MDLCHGTLTISRTPFERIGDTPLNMKQPRSTFDFQNISGSGVRHSADGSPRWSESERSVITQRIIATRTLDFRCGQKWRANQSQGTTSGGPNLEERFPDAPLDQQHGNCMELQVPGKASWNVSLSECIQYVFQGSIGNGLGLGLGQATMA